MLCNAMQCYAMFRYSIRWSIVLTPTLPSPTLPYLLFNISGVSSKYSGTVQLPLLEATVFKAVEARCLEALIRVKVSG